MVALSLKLGFSSASCMLNCCHRCCLGQWYGARGTLGRRHARVGGQLCGCSLATDVMRIAFWRNFFNSIIKTCQCKHSQSTDKEANPKVGPGTKKKHFFRGSAFHAIWEVSTFRVGYTGQVNPDERGYKRGYKRVLQT